VARERLTRVSNGGPWQEEFMVRLFVLRLTALAGVIAGPALALASPAASPTSRPPYQILTRWKPGGDGGWDYLTLDPTTRRLYIARATRVQVIDVDRGTLMGEITGTPGVHGVALAPDVGKGFASDGRDSAVTVFDPRNLATLGTIRVDAQGPDAIVYDHATRRVLVMGHRSGTATAIDAASDSVVGTIPLGGTAEYAVSDGRGEVFVNVESRSVVVGIDAKTLTVRSRWSLHPGEEPTGLAMDRAHRRLFVGCRNQRMIVLDADTGRVVADLPIGRGVDMTAFDSTAAVALSANGEGTLTVVHEDSPDRYTVLGQVETQRGARTLAVDPRTHRVYLVTAEFGPAPAPTAERPHPWPSILPDTFQVLVLEPTP
jgi:DNA-binding beta-propeller fold protein YncE